MLEVNGINTGEAPDQWIGHWPQPSTSPYQNGAEARYLRSGTSAHSARLVVTVCAPTAKYVPLTWRYRRCSIPSINKWTDRHILLTQPTDSVARKVSIHQKLSSCIVIEAQAYWAYYSGLCILSTFKSVILLIHHSLLGPPNVPSTVLLRAPKRPPWAWHQRPIQSEQDTILIHRFGSVTQKVTPTIQ